LENVQRQATRQLPTLAKLSYEERLIQLKIPTLAYRRIRGDMIEVYKIMNEIYDKNVTPFLKTRLESADRTSPTGNKYKLYIAKAPSINSFKNRLDKYWSDQDIIFNYKAKLNINRKSANGRIYEEQWQSAPETSLNLKA